MGKITWDLALKVTQFAVMVIIIVKETFGGGKKDDESGSGNSKTQ